MEKWMHLQLTIFAILQAKNKIYPKGIYEFV